MGVSICGYYRQVLAIVQHLDGERVTAAAGGLLTDAKCLMLSKVLTQLGNFGGFKREGCRGFCSTVVERMLGAPEAAQTPAAGSPCPAPGLAHPGTMAACSQNLLLKGLTLSQVANAAVNRLGVVGLGCIVPCSCCPGSRASGGCLSQDVAL